MLVREVIPTPIRYEKLFRLLKEKGLTKYSLRKDNVIGVATLEKMRKGVGHIDTRTIENLCAYLHCQPGDLMEYIPDEETDKGETNQ